MRAVVRGILFFVACVLLPVAGAQPLTYGDWQVGLNTSKDALYAATTNSSGGVLGQYCYPAERTCYWILGTDLSCDPGSTYPVLVNAEAGAAHHEIQCFRTGKLAQYAFKDFDSIDSIVRGAGRVGIAFPLASGLFQVSRFSLSGSVRAIDAMREIADEASSKEEKEGLKNLRL